MSGREIPWIDVAGMGATFKSHAAAGRELRYASGETEIVGDVNELGGVCDDCCATPGETVVIAWRDLRCDS